MRRWLRRFWIWINTPPIEVIAPSDFAVRRQHLEALATSQDRVKAFARKPFTLCAGQDLPRKPQRDYQDTI